MKAAVAISRTQDAGASEVKSQLLNGQSGPLHATRLLNIFENVRQPVVRDGLRNREGRVLLHEVVYERFMSAMLLSGRCSIGKQLNASMVKVRASTMT